MDGVPLDSVTDTPPDPGSKGNDGGCGGGMAMVSGGDGRRVLEAMLRSSYTAGHHSRPPRALPPPRGSCGRVSPHPPASPHKHWRWTGPTGPGESEERSGGGTGSVGAGDHTRDTPVTDHDKPSSAATIGTSHPQPRMMYQFSTLRSPRPPALAGPPVTPGAAPPSPSPPLPGPADTTGIA